MNDFSIRQHITLFFNKWLEENDVTDNAFANAVGVSAASVRRWRLGKCIPDIDLFPIVCNYMNVSIWEFMGLDKYALPKKQEKLILDYMEDKTFHSLIEKYQNDADFKSAIHTLIKLMK